MKAHLLRSRDEKVRLALDICEYLNELVAIDPAAIQRLMGSRVACNDGLLNHPTTQVSVTEGVGPCVGVLGLLNGLIGVGAASWGYVAAVYDDSHRLQCFVARIAESEAANAKGSKAES